MAHVKFVVQPRVAICLLVLVPGRQIQPEPDALLFSGVRNLSDNVAVPAPEGAGRHGVGGILGRPVAESVGMLKWQKTDAGFR